VIYCFYILKGSFKVIYLYARVSTDGQTIENQSLALKARFPEGELVADIVSGASEVKPQLDALMARLRPGDTLVVVAMDRLSRTMLQGARLIKNLSDGGIILISLREGLDLSTPMGVAMAHMMFVFAEMDLANIRARTKAGLVRAKAQGKQVGRIKGQKFNRKGEPIKPSPGRHKRDHGETIISMKKLRAKGLTIKELADHYHVSTGQVCKLLKLGA
jgi:DNA invertase Pin-like site-specific DNA recombinase